MFRADGDFFYVDEVFETLSLIFLLFEETFYNYCYRKRNSSGHCSKRILLIYFSCRFGNDSLELPVTQQIIPTTH